MKFQICNINNIINFYKKYIYIFLKKPNKDITN